VDTQFIYLIRQQVAGLTGQIPSGLGFLLVSVRLIFWCRGLFALVIVGLVVYSRTRARGRTKAMVDVGQELGFTFKGTNPDDETQLLQMPPTLLKVGSRCSNIMTGTAAGLETSIFDFLDSFIAPDASNRNASTVAAFRQNLSLPYFEMGPAPILNRYLQVPGLSTLNLTRTLCAGTYSTDRTKTRYGSYSLPLCSRSCSDCLFKINGKSRGMVPCSSFIDRAQSFAPTKFAHFLTKAPPSPELSSVCPASGSRRRKVVAPRNNQSQCSVRTGALNWRLYFAAFF